jgi:hypothetical protein
VEQFIRDGFVRIDEAFPRELAEEARSIMWRDIPCDPHDPATWTRPVIRLPGYGEAPFRKAANTALLHDAFDRLVGRGRWIPRDSRREWQVSGLYVLLLLAGNVFILMLIADVRQRMVQAFNIPSASMQPGILRGDWLFADKRYNCPGCKTRVATGDLGISSTRTIARNTISSA